MYLCKCLDYNLDHLRECLGKGPDLVFRDFIIGGVKEGALIYIDNMVDPMAISQYVMMPLMNTRAAHAEDILLLGKKVIGVGSVTYEKDIAKLADAIFSGNAVFILDGNDTAQILDVTKWEKRNISEPSNDVVVRGPREGFVETLGTNISLIRRKIHHPGLTFETMKIGCYSKTEVCITYLKGIANMDVLKELRSRLARIDIDSVLESGYIEEMIGDSPLSFYPTVGNTEKPDIFVARILEGRVGILVDGSPMVLTVPMLFVEGLQNSEDYYSLYFYSSIVRIIRYTALFLTLFLPAIYIAAVTYHQKLIPVRLLLTIAASEENTPFSAGFSVLLMTIAYEILREAGVRLPRPVGQAVSIVGAIVMGEAAVSAGLISAPVLIVVAMTVISSFVNIPLYNTCSVLRLIYIGASWSFGFYGILIAGLATLLHLSSIRSFTVPYFSPIAPLNFQQLKDVFVRFPLWSRQTKPKQLSNNIRRRASHLKPQPPKKRSE